MRSRSATAWLIRIGFWTGVVLAVAGPARAILDHLTAPVTLLSLRDAGRVSGARRTVDQSVVSIGNEPKAAIRVTPPARIEWPLRLRPGRHRIDTAVAIGWREGERPASVTFRILVSAQQGDRPVASVTCDPPGPSADRSWRPLIAEFETGAEPARLILAVDSAGGPVVSNGGVYWEAPRLATLTAPPRPWPVLFGLILALASLAAARRRTLSLGGVHNPVVWIAYTLSVSALLAEATLRLAGWGALSSPIRLAVAGHESAAWMDATVEDPELGYRYRPGLSMTWPWRAGDEPRSDVRFATDGDGFRNPPGVTSPRIVLLGDSFVEGDLVDEPETMRARLASETGAEVRNLALSGYGPQQYVIAARRFGLPARPEVVVVALFEGNDLGDAELFDQWRRTETPWNDYVLDVLRSQRESIVVRPRLRLRTLDALVAVRSRLWGLLVPPPEIAAPANPFDRRCEDDPVDAGCMRFEAGFLHRGTRSAEEWSASRGWALTRAALVELRNACRDAGGRPIVLLVPSKESLYVPRRVASISPEAFDRFVGGAAGVAGPYFDRFLANHGALDRVIEPFLRQEGIDFLNLRPIFSRAEDEGRRLYYRLDMHWNALGHEEAARALADGLEALGWSDEGVSPPGA